MSKSVHGCPKTKRSTKVRGGSFLIHPISSSLVSNSPHKTTTRTTRTTTRTTRIGFRGFRTIHIRSPPKGGLLIGVVLTVLVLILVVLGGVLVVLGVVLVVLELVLVS